MKFFEEAKTLLDFWEEFEEEFSNILFEDWSMKRKVLYQTFNIKGEEKCQKRKN